MRPFRPCIVPQHIKALKFTDMPQPLAKRLRMWTDKKWHENTPCAEWADERWADSMHMRAACWRMMIARLYPGYDYVRSYL